MGLKTDAEVTVDADQLVTMRIGNRNVDAAGTTGVKIPPHVARQFEEDFDEESAVTVTTESTEFN